jgi:hypothetical protein
VKTDRRRNDGRRRLIKIANPFLWMVKYRRKMFLVLGIEEELSSKERDWRMVRIGGV